MNLIVILKISKGKSRKPKAKRLKLKVKKQTRLRTGRSQKPTTNNQISKAKSHRMQIG